MLCSTTRNHELLPCTKPGACAWRLAPTGAAHALPDQMLCLWEPSAGMRTSSHEQQRDRQLPHPFQGTARPGALYLVRRPGDTAAIGDAAAGIGHTVDWQD